MPGASIGALCLGIVGLAAPAAAGAARLAETLTYSPRHRLTSIVRGDLNGRGSVFGYDAAGQLAGKAARLGPSLPNNAPSAGSPLAADGIGEAFKFDRAQNLIERTERFLGLDTPVALPVDASGRNRPGSVNGQALTWDANGNPPSDSNTNGRLFFPGGCSHTSSADHC